MLKMLMEDFKKLSKVSNKTPLNGQLGDLKKKNHNAILSFTEACKRAYYSCEILIPSLLMPITDVPTND